MARRRSRSPVLTVVLVLVGLYLLYLALPNVGPVVRAARLDGAPGTFTAERLHCVRHPGHESCSWQGRFRSDDGTVRHEDVWMYGSGRDSLRPGQRVRAFDTGRDGRVYGPGGSREWVPVTLMAALGVTLLAYAVLRPGRRPRPEEVAPEHAGEAAPLP
ncbi:MAG TPA: hypothetical protein VHJ17_15645 [Thermomonospora sp.]|nr:hypothetical protein [Thermomonospora sp.]